MPLHAMLYINDKPIGSITIARTQKLRGQDAEHKYVVVAEADRAQATFTHRYSDGAEVCLRKALEALENVRQSGGANKEKK